MYKRLIWIFCQIVDAEMKALSKKQQYFFLHHGYIVELEIVRHAYMIKFTDQMECSGERFRTIGPLVLGI